MSDEWKTVECKWVFKMKFDEKKWVVKFKVRLVTQRILQIYEINYQKIFVFTVHRELLRMFLILMILYDLKLHQINVKVTYLLRNLKSEKKKYTCAF